MSPQLSGFRPQSLKLLGHLSTTSDENRWRMTAQRAGLHEGLAPQCSGSGSEREGRGVGVGRARAACNSQECLGGSEAEAGGQSK